MPPSLYGFILLKIASVLHKSPSIYYICKEGISDLGQRFSTCGSPPTGGPRTSARWARDQGWELRFFYASHVSQSVKRYQVLVVELGVVHKGRPQKITPFHTPLPPVPTC